MADWLRSRDDAWLARLITLRPDAAYPAPHDMSTLASRLSVRMSVARALDELTAWDVQVLDGLMLGPQPGTAAAVKANCAGARIADVRRATERLRDLALIWGADDAINVPAPVRDAAHRHIAGLGRPAAELFDAYRADSLRVVLHNLDLPYAGQPMATGLISDRLRSNDTLAGLLQRAPDGALDILRQLDGGTPVGDLRNADRLLEVTDDMPPVRWLTSHGLLASVGASSVELPREVGLHLRGTTPLGPARSTPPTVDTSTYSADDVNGTAATHAQDAVRRMTRLLELVGELEPRVLRTGGLGSRETKKIAKLLEVEQSDSNLLLHVAEYAGLLAPTRSHQPIWLPTTTYDEWLTDSLEERWQTIATAWIDMPALSWLSNDGTADSPHALSNEVNRAGAAATRRRMLQTLAGIEKWSTADTDALLEIAAWRWPRRMSPSVATTAHYAIRDAEFLGITGKHALSAPGRALVDGADPTTVTTLLTATLPAPIDYVLLQADLTAIAPGRLTPELSDTMAQVADVESAGGATVYRITEATIRRALDSGMPTAQLHELWATHSKTPVPQALTYLIDDIGRRHGALRAGGATAYLRCDDPTTLNSALTNSSLSHLRLRRLAPTVLITEADPADLVSGLREAGFMPTLENEQGVVTTALAAPARSKPRLERRTHGTTFNADESAALVRNLRDGDRVTEASASAQGRVSSELPGVTTAATLSLLQSAVSRGAALSLDYVDESGTLTTRLVTPERVAGGYMHALDHRTRDERVFAIHRIVSVALAVT
ncbi:XPB/Ssl2-like helicase family protein [Antricoccus suffuscus]|uniref:XPB/Ssl2-like helicase family protein n=2 Tax=Antricoccus suffuscus TaxID=1629062 RepID=A0A2T0ZJW7_9ACTN|nr:XPB/Ssl2-like helicase family protein [Antricoccus suffuscus]